MKSILGMSVATLSLVLALAGCGDDKKCERGDKKCGPSDYDDGGNGDANVEPDGGEGPGDLQCFGDESLACSSCLAEKCCPSFGPCSGNSDCYNGYSCLLRCGTALGDCLAACEAETEGSALWAPLAACAMTECAATSCQPAQ